MSKSVVEFVDGVEGVRGGVADAVGQRFATVAELSEASPEALTAVNGVGPVLAERILAAARTAVIADHTPDAEPAPDPATRRRAAVGQARAATRPSLDVVTGGTADRDPAEPDLPAVVERLATLVGVTIGWSIRLVRTVTQPVRQLVGRG